MGLGREPHGNASERLGAPCTRASDHSLHTLKPQTLNPKNLNPWTLNLKTTNPKP